MPVGQDLADGVDEADVASAYAAAVRAQVAFLTVLNTQISTVEEQVEAHFGTHPDAKIYLGQPGLGVVLGARVLAEFRRRQGSLRLCKVPQEVSPAPARCSCPHTLVPGKGRTIRDITPTKSGG